MAPNINLSTGFSPKALGIIFRRRRSSTSRRSRRFVARIARRWVTGIRKCAMKSSVKHCTAVASSVSKSAMTPAARSLLLFKSTNSMYGVPLLWCYTCIHVHTYMTGGTNLSYHVLSTVLGLVHQYGPPLEPAGV